MNILLLNGLPEEIDGIEISADFRNMIQMDLLLRDDEITDFEKTLTALNLLYPEIPPDVTKAIEGLEWFYSRGEVAEPGESSAGQQSSPKRAFCFEQDANLIFSGFYSVYGISLTTIEFLHWWEFMALFEGLPEDTLMKKVIYWRTVDVNKLPKGEKKSVIRLRKLFALKNSTLKKQLTEKELIQQTLDRADRRYLEAQALLEKRQSGD